MSKPLSKKEIIELEDAVHAAYKDRFGLSEEDHNRLYLKQLAIIKEMEKDNT